MEEGGSGGGEAMSGGGRGEWMVGLVVECR
jgi:hypothetical protein